MNAAAIVTGAASVVSSMKTIVKESPQVHESLRSLIMFRLMPRPRKLYAQLDRKFNVPQSYHALQTFSTGSLVLPRPELEIDMNIRLSYQRKQCVLYVGPPNFGKATSMLYYLGGKLTNQDQVNGVIHFSLRYCESSKVFEQFAGACNLDTSVYDGNGKIKSAFVQTAKLWCQRNNRPIVIYIEEIGAANIAIQEEVKQLLSFLLGLGSFVHLVFTASDHSAEKFIDSVPGAPGEVDKVLFPKTHPDFIKLALTSIIRTGPHAVDYHPFDLQRIAALQEEMTANDGEVNEEKKMITLAQLLPEHRPDEQLLFESSDDIDLFVDRFGSHYGDVQKGLELMIYRGLNAQDAVSSVVKEYHTLLYDIVMQKTEKEEVTYCIYSIFDALHAAKHKPTPCDAPFPPNEVNLATVNQAVQLLLDRNIIARSSLDDPGLIQFTHRSLLYAWEAVRKSPSVIKAMQEAKQAVKSVYKQPIAAGAEEAAGNGQQQQ